MKRRTLLHHPIYASLLAALFIFLAACGGDPSAEAYRQAAELLDSGSYAEAAEAFSALGDYRDSADLAAEAEKAAVYESAAAMQECGDYGSAGELFSSLGDYRDSADRAAVCAEALAEEELERSYAEALSLMDEGRREDALKRFRELGDYGKAELFALRCAAALSEPGDSLFFGTWPQGENDELLPIEWIVLDKAEDRVLLLSRCALEAQRYAPKLYPTWAASPIRDWLNGDFFDTAFTAEEQEHILQVTNSTENFTSSLGRYLGGPDSEDRVFLLSRTELSRCLPRAEQRACPATAHAAENGCAVDAQGNCVWWLRSPGNHHGRLCTVIRSGEINVESSASNASVGVRPALWLSF